MYVCVCKAVTDGQVREAVSQGCCSLRELRIELGVGAQCGRCLPLAREVLDEALQECARDIAGAA